MSLSSIAAPLSALPRRALNLGGAAVCAALLACAYYMQFGMGLEPCPLCILQRLAVIALGLALLGAGVLGAEGRARIAWTGMIGLSAGGGLLVAGRHVWLQSLPPDQVPACGPGLDYLIDALPLFDALEEAFHGSGECARIDWTLLGLSLPVWTLMAFIVLGAVGLWNNLRVAPRRG